MLVVALWLTKLKMVWNPKVIKLHYSQNLKTLLILSISVIADPFVFQTPEDLWGEMWNGKSLKMEVKQVPKRHQPKIPQDPKKAPMDHVLPMLTEFGNTFTKNVMTLMKPKRPKSKPVLSGEIPHHPQNPHHMMSPVHSKHPVPHGEIPQPPMISHVMSAMHDAMHLTPLPGEKSHQADLPHPKESFPKNTFPVLTWARERLSNVIPEFLSM